MVLEIVLPLTEKDGVELRQCERAISRRQNIADSFLLDYSSQGIINDRIGLMRYQRQLLDVRGGLEIIEIWAQQSIIEYGEDYQLPTAILLYTTQDHDDIRDRVKAIKQNIQLVGKPAGLNEIMTNIKQLLKIN